MPGRIESLVNNSIYHIFNKTIDGKKIFIDANLCKHFLDLIKYYRSVKSVISYSKLKNLDGQLKQQIIRHTLKKKYFQIEILAYCLMPTHYHFLIRQIKSDGIKRFISNIINAFTKFHNIKSDRDGPIFLSRFKSVRIQSDEQLLHVSRYIHLNPYSSGVVESFDNLDRYNWSSYREYVKLTENGICNSGFVLEHFNNKKSNYLEFMKNNADYQKTLEYIKYADKWF